MKSFELKNISYSYPLDDKKVFENLSFDIEENTFISIIGNNGSGKTTLCNIMRQFIPIFYKGNFSGEIRLFGKILNSYNSFDLVKTIGYMSQNPFVQISGARRTVFDEIAFGLENLGYAVHDIKIKVDAILEMFGISELRFVDPLVLSGGLKQKVALASLVAMDTKVLILDEPTSQLDPGATREIFKLLNELKKQGKTIIIAEHKMEFVAEYSDEVIFLNNGTLERHGSPEDVFMWILNQDLQMQVPEFMKVLQYLKRKKILNLKNGIPTNAKEARRILKNEGITYEFIKSH